MARPRLILLVRHGESQGNKDKSINRYTPNHKVPLTDKGHEQARQAGIELDGLLKPDDTICFYTSPYLRARQTLSGIIENLSDNVDFKVYEEPRMREQDFGNFQGTAKEMEDMWIERAQYGHFFYRIPHGESAADVYDRCASFNETLFRQFSKDSFPSVLILVTHGIWARVFLAKWFRYTVEYFEDLQNVPHCKFIVMEKDPDTQRYKLNTKLDRWSDLQGPKRTEKMKHDTYDELQFNYAKSLHYVSENVMNEIVEAEVQARSEQIEKSLKLKEMYEKLKQKKKNHRPTCSGDPDDDHADSDLKNVVD